MRPESGEAVRLRLAQDHELGVLQGRTRHECRFVHATKTIKPNSTRVPPFMVLSEAEQGRRQSSCARSRSSVAERTGSSCCFKTLLVGSQQRRATHPAIPDIHQKRPSGIPAGAYVPTDFQGETIMKRVLIVTAGCALLMGPGQALAQSAPVGPDRGSGRMERQDAGWDRDGRGGWGRVDRDRDDRRTYRDDDGPDRDRDGRRAYRSDDGPRGSREDEHGREGPHGRSLGAGFRLQSGDTRLEMRCNPDESMRACVDAATTLLERARTSPNTGAGSTPPASSGPGAPNPR
jgi:hypothetical protein